MGNKIKYFEVLIILVIASIFLVGNASAVFTSTNPQLAPDTTATPSFDSALCQQGQDFIVQISPSGCTPVIVRSDLLEEQDVQVYCPLSATQINPMIDVKSIDGISFSGNYSQYVRSIGFYPAQAALNLQGEQKTYPLLSNVGYVVINLKQIPNESAMPDFVTGNLTAKINYDADKVFGTGNVNYYLPELSDSEWESNYPEYGFWNGKGFLRADSIEGDTATIKVYDSNLNEKGTASLKQGETSNPFSISGFGFCSGGAQIKLNALKNADTRVKLDVNGDLVEASKGEKFLDNNCQIADIQRQGLTRSTKIICTTDAGRKSFDLKVAPQLNLEVNGESRTVSLGDYLYTFPGEYNALTNINGGKSIFLGYIGSTSVEPDLKNLYVVLVAVPRTAVQNQNQLSNEELSSVAGWIQKNKMDWVSGSAGIVQVLKDTLKVFLGSSESIIRLIVQGQSFAVLPYDFQLHAQILNLKGELDLNVAQSVKLVGFAEGQNAILELQARNYYESAVNSYDAVSENYALETYPSDSETSLGEQALYEKIMLANQLQQKFTIPVLCDEFNERYPNSKLDEDRKICSDAALLASSTASSQYVAINGHSYVIGLRGIFTPTYDDYGAQVTVKYSNGSSKTFPLIKDELVIINGTDFMQLGELTQTTAVLNGNVKAFTANRAVLTLGEPGVFGNYVLVLDDVNLKQFAQVSVIPQTKTIGSSADFSFNIGIEKRFIQLNPDKIKERLDALNEGISKWESVLNTTEKVVQGLTTACEGVGAVLTAKNFVENLLGGDAGARQVVMRNIWNTRCSEGVREGTYISQEQCFLENSDAIDSDVSQYAEFRKQQNEEIKDLENPATSNSILGGSVVDTEEFMQSYAPQVQSSLDDLSSIQNPENSEENISTADAKRLMNYSNWKNNNFRVSDARDVELYATILASGSSSEVLKSLARQELYSTLKDIKVNSDTEILHETLGSDTGLGSENVMIGTFQKRNDVSITSPRTFASSKYSTANPSAGIPASNYAFVFRDSSNSINYLIAYGQDGVVTGTYIIGVGDKLTVYTAEDKVVTNPFNFFFAQYNEGSYKNAYKEPRVHYFETEPYKGMPAIVPIDVDEGWYAGLKQTLGTGNNIRTYDASARVNSFYLCNVGRNGVQEFNSGIGDDTCQSIDLGTGSTYSTFPGISQESIVIALVNRAKSAITDAARAYQSGVDRVVIDGRNFQVGTPASNLPSIQCQDFMSPRECNLLFNLCDPVICPSSRCDFGGAYPVASVQQTGIIGSALLCLPNAREGIAVPVCLSGIQSGMENLLSVEKAYAECLQEKLETGKTTGVCDELNSIYMCSFFWEQAAPLANLAVPKITEALLGQSSRGGGEYLSVQNAFDTAKQSTDYLTNYYAGSSQAFKLSTLNIGSAFCRNFASFTVPSGAEILEQISTPDSPPQYTGRFEEISLTTATIPPTSQYKVSYRIYAGRNDGVYYSVYLERSAGSSFYQDGSSTLAIDSGYIASGGFAAETIDKSAISGYDRLCINVNGQVECGFQQVSTSFAVDYLQDQYLSTEVTRTDITKESDCKSGSANIYSLLNPNLQNAVSDVINPELYNQGITRTCATDNPGIGTDVHAGAEGSRWVEVGYCDDTDVKCWLDTKGIKDILNSPDLAEYFSNGTTTTLGETALDSVKDNYFSILMGTGYLNAEEFTSKIQKINSEENAVERLNLISETIDKVFYNNQKGYLFLLRAGTYGQLAVSLTDTESLNKAAAAAQTGGLTTGDEPDLYPITSGGESSVAITPGTARSGDEISPGVVLNAENILRAMNYAKENTVVNRKCLCGNNCEIYANSMVAAAEKYEEDPLLLLSIMMQESSCDANAAAITSGGVVTDIGLMQINVWEECTYDLKIMGQGDLIGFRNADKNIQCGALILKKKFDAYSSGQKYPSNEESCDGFSTTYSGWDAALRGYNGYGCLNLDYVPEVNARYTALKSYLSGLVAPKTEILGACVAVIDANHIKYQPEPIAEQAFSEYVTSANSICERCQIPSTSAFPGLFCDAAECEFFSNQAAKQYNVRCAFTADTRGSLGGSCSAIFDVNYIPYEERAITEQPTEQDQNNAKFTCNYCSSGLSTDGSSCSYNECVLAYGDEAARKFNMRCNFLPEGATAAQEQAISARPNADDKSKAQGVCGYCFNLFSLGSVGCSADECEGKLGPEATEKFFMKCQFGITSDNRRTCTAVTEAEYAPYSPASVPTAPSDTGDEEVFTPLNEDDLTKVENTCRFCFNLLSKGSISCSKTECESDLGTIDLGKSYLGDYAKCQFIEKHPNTGRNACIGVLKEDYELPIPEEYKQLAGATCATCIRSIGANGALCSREECEVTLSTYAQTNYNSQCKYVSEEKFVLNETRDTSFTLGGACIVAGDEVPTQQDKEDAKEVCGFCRNALSPYAGCQERECEIDLAREAIQRFNVDCKYLPGPGGDLIGGNCVTEFETEEDLKKNLVDVETLSGAVVRLSQFGSEGISDGNGILISEPPIYDEPGVITASHVCPRDGICLVKLYNDVETGGTIKSDSRSKTRDFLYLYTFLEDSEYEHSLDFNDFSDAYSVGENVFLLGYPNTDDSATIEKREGQITKVERNFNVNIDNQNIDLPEVIFTTINVEEGFSGSPLFDSEGKIIGIIFAKQISPESSLAVPIKYAENLIKETFPTAY